MFSGCPFMCLCVRPLKTLFHKPRGEFKSYKQGIHRHQTPPRYRNAAPRIAIPPITAKDDVIH